MKRINELHVKVSYKVGLSELEVPDEVFSQLEEIADKNLSIELMMMNYPEATEWLLNNIKEADCCEIAYEIENLN